MEPMLQQWLYTRPTNVQILSNHAPVKNLQIHRTFWPKTSLSPATAFWNSWQRPLDRNILQLSSSKLHGSSKIGQSLDTIYMHVRICTTMSLYCINVSTPLRCQESTELIYVGMWSMLGYVRTYVRTYLRTLPRPTHWDMYVNWVHSAAHQEKW